MAFEVDLGKNARGERIGAFRNPAEGERRLPLAIVVVTRREVRFATHATRGGGAFHATLRDDGRAMAGRWRATSRWRKAAGRSRSR